MLSNSIPVPMPSLESPPSSPGLLLDEYERWLGRVRSLTPYTVRRRRKYLERFISQPCYPSSDRLLRSLCVARVQAFMVEYACIYGPGSQKWMVDSLRGFLRFCHTQRYLAEDLSCAVPSRCNRQLGRVPRSLDDDCIEKLLASIDRSDPLGLRDVAVVTLAAVYGVRGVQIRSLRVHDIDWEGEQIRFPAAKGGKTVCVPLTAEAGNAVADYLQNGRPNETPYAEVFLTSRPPVHPFDASGGLSHIVSRRLKRAGIKVPAGVSRGIYGFRHAFGSRLVGRVPFKHISDLMGHRNPSTTFIYTKVDFIGLAETTLPWPEEVIL